jgi:alpha,alpha-trehalase
MQSGDIGRGYRPIRDYGIIGDCHGNALVASDGGIDWCCLGRHDGEPVFFRVLDANKGGFWSIQPTAEAQLSRRYRQGTNILETTFETAEGSLTVTDLMPVGRHVDAGPHDHVRLIAPFWLIRRVACTRGSVEVEIRFRPSAGLDEPSVELELDGEAIRPKRGPVLFARLPFELVEEGRAAVARVTVAACTTHDLVLAARTVSNQSPLDRVAEVTTITEAFWREWLTYNRYTGPHEEAVRRSALALKLLTYAPTGAIVAAATTSLPEAIGGERNWDYRYSWLRDSCFTLYALAGIGYGGEARSYVDYLTSCIRKTLPREQIMYGIERETVLTEKTHDHLEGYCQSPPVRTGNGAWDQRQIDVYGQVLDLAVLYECLGGRLGRQEHRLLEAFAGLVEQEWTIPDHGLWEMRGPSLHHVHGKLMAWVAADRAARLGFGEAEHWRTLAKKIEREIKDRGIAPEGYLRQAYERPGVDAANLLAPMLGFPMDDADFAKTVDAVDEQLRHGPFLHRYKTDDGLAGEEGAFLICSFWHVDALLSLDRGEEAEAMFQELEACANDLDLYSEEIDPDSRAFLGNFPQAFTHLALIASAVNLNLYKPEGKAGIQGSYADRARRAVGAVYGSRGMLKGMDARDRGGRVRHSSASVLLWP